MKGIRIEFSDHELQFRVQSFLKSRHFPAFEKLEVDVHDGAVTLSGALPSYYEKQVAINSCMRVAGVITLVDKIVVSKTKKRRLDRQTRQIQGKQKKANRKAKV